MTSDFGADIFDEEPPPPEPPPRAAAESTKGADEVEEVRLQASPARRESESDLVFDEAAQERETTPPAGRDAKRPSAEEPRGEVARDQDEERRGPQRQERRSGRHEERSRDRGRGRGRDRERDHGRERDRDDRGGERRDRHGRGRDRDRDRRHGRPQRGERPHREDATREPRAERPALRPEAEHEAGSLDRWTPSRAAPVERRRPAAEEGQRLALLIDYAGLQESAHRLGGELSFRRLLKQIAGDRPLIRSVCYVPKDTPEAVIGPMKATGFEVFEVQDSATANVAAAVDGMALAPRVDCIVLAPGSGSLAPLAKALAATGVRVETASFEGASTMPGQHRRLGRNCVFVP